MFGSTFALAMGVVLLAIVRFSADPGTAHSIVAVLGIVFVATGCALHTAAILNEIAFFSPVMRAAVTAMGWISWIGATMWLLGLDDPRPEIGLAAVMVPAVLGVARFLISPTNRGWAIAFLIEAVALIALLGPVFLRRMG